MRGRSAQTSKIRFVHAEKRVISSNSRAFRQQSCDEDGIRIRIEGTTQIAVYAYRPNVVSMLMLRENDQIESCDINFVVHSVNCDSIGVRTRPTEPRRPEKSGDSMVAIDIPIACAASMWARAWSGPNIPVSSGACDGGRTGSNDIGGRGTPRYGGEELARLARLARSALAVGGCDKRRWRLRLR
jgi:hypothetical protein